jgi:N-acetylmuramic acid 6-phosphate etherase
MQLKNDKLVDRAQRMVMNELNVSLETAKDLLAKNKSIREAIKAFQNS